MNVDHAALAFGYVALALGLLLVAILLASIVWHEPQVLFLFGGVAALWVAIYVWLTWKTSHSSGG